MISSASRTVDSRCAMITQAQPRRRRLSAITCSVSGSSALVASSSTSRAGLGTRARASSSRCRWPPLKFRPPSSTRLWMPPARPATRSKMAASRSAALTASSVRRRRPTASGCPRRCPRTARCPGRRRTPTTRSPPGQISARGLPSSSIWPDHGSYRPVTSRPIVDLPLPEPPTIASRRPGDHRERDVLQHRRGQRVVAEGHVG